MKIINEKLLNYAIESLKSGISVIPVGKNKIPLISWKQYQEKHATEEEVRSWFEKFDDPQIGFCTGKISNLIVVDVEKGGDPSFLPQETTIVGTGGGGYHYYFKYQEGIKNKVRIKKLVDFRGDGGYVISPNSHNEKGAYKMLQKAELLNFPKELFPELFQDQFNVFSLPETTSQSNFNNNKDLEEYTGFGSGQRNDELTRYIGYVLTQIHPLDWDTKGWEIIQKANNKNTPPLGQKELYSTFNSIKQIEKRSNPLGRSKNSYEQTPVYLDDGTDNVIPLYEIAKMAEEKHSENYPLQMKCFDDLIDGGVSPGDLIAIAGPTGEGKTTLAQDWTVSMIKGEKKLGVLWFTYEILPRNLWKKFALMGLTKDEFLFAPTKNTTGDISWVEKKIKEAKGKFNIKVVFIDHLGFLSPKTQGLMGKKIQVSHPTFLTQAVRDLKSIAINEEVAIFLPVHVKKVDRRISNSNLDLNDIKDSAGIPQESDLVFLIERERNKDRDATTYYTDTTKISLAKNRKNGSTLIANFTFLNGRFAYDDRKEKALNDFTELLKKGSNDTKENELNYKYTDAYKELDNDEKNLVDNF